MKSVVLPALLMAALAAPVVSHALGEPLDGSRSPAALTLKGVDPPPALVEAGDDAPDVSWESPQGWRRLRDLRSQGAVLLVFGAREDDLRHLERERLALLRMGVVPAAVLDRRAGACQAIARRNSLGFPVLPDPQRVISAQFNSLDPRTRLAVPSWFVVDRAGRVRGLDRGALPRDGWAALTAEALHLPLPGISLPASSK